MPSDPKKRGVSFFDRTTSRPDPLRALVVDDNSFTLNLVRRMLEALGFQVDAANGGVQAKQLADRCRYSLVLTDFQMPEIDGYALATWFKGNFEFTRVFVMTGCSRDEVVDYINTGLVDRWIFKPFSLSQLGELVDGLAGVKS